MKKHLLCLVFVCLLSAGFSQRTLTIRAIPSEAEIFQVVLGKESLLGIGSGQLKLEKDIVYSFRIKKDGYVTQDVTYLRKKDNDPALKANPVFIVRLEDRVVRVNASPSDCRIYCNGADKGAGPVDVEIKKGQSVAIEVKKAGYVSSSLTYYNKEGQDVPEASHLFTLTDRLVSFKCEPVDATVYIDGKKAGEGSASIIVPKDKCVDVKIEKDGFAPVTTSYCNKDNEVVPPLTDFIRMKDRMIKINAMPDDASIYIDGKEVGKGSYTVKIPDGKCTQVLIKRTQYVTEKRELCNKADMQQPEAVYPLKLTADEAYEESEQSNNANNNFNIVVSPKFTEITAWKQLTSIIMQYFDVETIDANSGYLRTNWIGKTYNKNSLTPTIIRTRVRVTMESLSPLKYNLMIQSEMSKSSDDETGLKCIMPPINQDQCFEKWPRLLRAYAELTAEVQRRLMEK